MRKETYMLKMIKKVVGCLFPPKPVVLELNWDEFLAMAKKERPKEIFGKMIFLDKREGEYGWYRYYRAVLFFLTQDGKRAEYFQRVWHRPGKSVRHLDEKEQGLYGIQIFVNLEAYFSKIQEVIPGTKTTIVNDFGKPWSEGMIHSSWQIAEKLHIKAKI